MNLHDPRHPWSRLVTAARRADDPRDEAAPYGFATRVAALAFAQEGRTSSLMDRFALRAVGLASLLAVASIVFNFTHSPTASTPTVEEHATADDDAMAALLDA